MHDIHTTYCMSDHPGLITVCTKKNVFTVSFSGHLALFYHLFCIVMEKIAVCWKRREKDELLVKKTFPKSEQKRRCSKKKLMPLFCFQCHLHPQKLTRDELLPVSSRQGLWEISGWQLRFQKLNVGNLKFVVSKVWTQTTLQHTFLD